MSKPRAQGAAPLQLSAAPVPLPAGGGSNPYSKGGHSAIAARIGAVPATAALPLKRVTAAAVGGTSLSLGGQQEEEESAAGGRLAAERGAKVSPTRLYSYGPSYVSRTAPPTFHPAVPLKPPVPASPPFADCVSPWPLLRYCLLYSNLQCAISVVLSLPCYHAVAYFIIFLAIALTSFILLFLSFWGAGTCV